MMQKSRTHGTAKSGKAHDVLLAIEEAVAEFAATHEEEPSMVWLHPTWASESEDLEDELMYAVTYDHDLMGPQEFAVGGNEAFDESPTPSAIHNNGNMWTQFDVPKPLPHKIIDAAVRTKAKFKKATGIDAQYLSLHESLMPVKDEIAAGTGLMVVTDPTVAYETWGLVGLPETLGVEIPVESTNIKSIEFYPDDDEEDEPVGTLFVAFHRRNNQTPITYEYLKVPTKTYKELLNASSKGGYVNKHIKNQYKGEKLEKVEG
jgi:hypothetical protein